MFCICSHLSISFDIQPSFQFIPADSPTKFGFLACGVYPFHFVVSNRTRLCGTFKLASIVALRIKVAVKLMPRLIYSSSTNTTIIADCASMDFPLTIYVASDCRFNLLFFTLIKNSFFQTRNTF